MVMVGLEFLDYLFLTIILNLGFSVSKLPLPIGRDFPLTKIKLIKIIPSLNICRIWQIDDIFITRRGSFP